MTFNRDIHHRHSIRLQGYDYSEAGAYFVTLCAYERQCLFGEIVDGEMHLNDFGQIVATEWIRTGELRTEIETGEYVVMPNHFHGIVTFTENINNTIVGAIHELPIHELPIHELPPQTPQQRRKMALPKIIGRFKMITAKRINIHRDTPGVPAWQRNYYEHIIRDEADYTRIAEYIADNPHRWTEDTLHPENFRDVVNSGNTGVDKNSGENGNIGGDGNIVGAIRELPLRTAQIRNSTAEFLIFSKQAGDNTIEVRIEDETVWLTQKLMALLFDVSVPTINEHLANIYRTGEITREATVRDFRTVQKEGSREVKRNVEFYNLDAIISVGYRVNSERATQFRQWATGILRDFAIRGYVLDKERLFESDFDKMIKQLQEKDGGCNE